MNFSEPYRDIFRFSPFGYGLIGFFGIQKILIPLWGLELQSEEEPTFAKRLTYFHPIFLAVSLYVIRHAAQTIFKDPIYAYFSISMVACNSANLFYLKFTTTLVCYLCKYLQLALLYLYQFSKNATKNRHQALLNFSIFIRFMGTRVNLVLAAILFLSLLILFTIKEQLFESIKKPSRDLDRFSVHSFSVFTFLD